MGDAIFCHHAYPLNNEVKCCRRASIGLYDTIVRYGLEIGQSFFSFAILYYISAKTPGWPQRLEGFRYYRRTADIWGQSSKRRDQMSLRNAFFPTNKAGLQGGASIYAFFSFTFESCGTLTFGFYML